MTRADPSTKTLTRSATRRRRALASLAAVAAAVLIAACGSSSGSSGSGKQQTLVIYSAQHPETTSAIVDAFEKANPDINVQLKNDDEDVFSAQIEQEGSHSPADVFYTENSNWLAQLDSMHLLAKVPSATLARVPSKDSASDGDWLGVTGRYSAIIYNPSKIPASQVPKTAMALAEPRYKGKLELTPEETDFWPIVTSIAQHQGQSAALKWLQGMKANAGSDDHTPDNETLVGDVSAGRADMGLINHYYFFRIRQEMGASKFHAKLSWLKPDDPGFVEDVSGAGILKSAPHQAAAEKFLAFLVSQPGQSVISHSASFEYPLVKGVAPNQELPPVSSLHPNSIGPNQIGTADDAHQLLVQAGLL